MRVWLKIDSKFRRPKADGVLRLRSRRAESWLTRIRVMGKAMRGETDAADSCGVGARLVEGVGDIAEALLGGGGGGRV